MRSIEESFHAKMRDYTTIGIGGAADRVAFPRSPAEVREILAAERRAGRTVHFLGAGSNLLVSDGGVTGTVLCTKKHLSKVVFLSDGSVVAEAGVMLPRLAVLCALSGLSGVEPLSGIITPHQSPESITQDTGLDTYIASLEKVRRIPGIDLALGAHEEPIPRLTQRIVELETFHKERLAKIHALCTAEPLSLKQISDRMFGERYSYIVCSRSRRPAPTSSTSRGAASSRSRTSTTCSRRPTRSCTTGRRLRCRCRTRWRAEPARHTRPEAPGVARAPSVLHDTSPCRSQARHRRRSCRPFSRYPVPYSEGGSSAHYNPGADRIQMPTFADFVTGNAFYATLAHEAIHSTGHASRLARETLRDYGKAKEIRAAEELIAEIGGAMLCAQLGMEAAEREDHAAYVASCLTALRNDEHAIFRAATAAQAGSELILSHMAAPAMARAA